MNSREAWVVDPAAYTPEYCARLVQSLQRCGSSARLITSKPAFGDYQDWPSGTRFEFQRLTSRIGARGATRRMLAGLEHPASWIGVVRELGRRRSEVLLHLQWCPVPAFDHWVLKAVKRLALPVVLTVHNVVPHAEGRGRESTFGALYSGADSLIVHTESSRRRLIADFGIAPQKIHVIPLGPLGQAKAQCSRIEARRQLDLPLDRPLAVSLGAWRQNKNLEAVIESFGHVPQSAMLVIAGRPEGVDRATLNLALMRVGREQSVRLWDRYLTEEEFDLLVIASDCVICAYTSGDASGVVSHASTHGRAVVISDQGGLAEGLRQDYDAMIVLPTADSIGAALREVLSDRDRADRMGASLRKTVTEGRGWAMVAARTSSVYDQVSSS